MDNELVYIGQSIGMIGVVFVYVWLKVWIYKREYGNHNPKETKEQNKETK